MKKLLVLALVCLSFSAFSVGAQSIAPSLLSPVADGIVESAEYSQSATYTGMKLSSSLSADKKTLFFALEAPTTGWVSVGLGSLKMNGAFMVLGSYENGTQLISEETGRGHSKTKNAVQKLTSGTVRELNGITVLEFAVPAAEYVGGTTLKVIMAYGKKDNLNSFHSKFDAVEFSILN